MTKKNAKMKNYRPIIFYFSLLLLLTQCGTNQNRNEIQFDLDGITWKSEAVIGIISTQGGAFVMDVQANISNGEKIQLKIQSTNQSGVGTYLVNNLTQNNIVFALDGNLESNNSFRPSKCTSTATNQIQITQYDSGFVAGTFTATVCNSGGTSKKITNGSFTIVEF